MQSGSLRWPASYWSDKNDPHHGPQQSLFPFQHADVLMKHQDLMRAMCLMIRRFFRRQAPDKNVRDQGLLLKLGTASSIGESNTCFEFSCGRMKPQGLSWALIQTQGDLVQVHLRVLREVGALGKVLA